jgi:predicted DNA-binding transcriptional regulator AlpA
MSSTETAEQLKSPLINEKAAARYIGMSESFLRKGRMQGTRQGKTPPPPFLRLGRSIKYRISDLDSWLEARRVSR